MRNRVRLADVSQEAGVSLTTVSLVVNNRDGGIPPETRQRVLEVVKRLGYRPHAPARALKTGRTHQLGIVMDSPESFVRSGNYYADVLSGIVERTVWHDHNLLLHTANYGDLRALPAEILCGSADGAILVGRAANDPLAALLLDAGFPTVCVSYSIDHPDCVSVDCDNEQGAYQAARHLLSLGHERLVFLYPGEEHSWGAERHRGALRAIREAGLDDRHLITLNWSDASLPTVDWAAEIAQRISSQIPRPTGVVCCDEGRASRLIEALTESGLHVPGDIALVSFNSTDISERSDPPMTSMWQPLKQLGIMAVDLLMDLVEDRPVPNRAIRFPMRLDLRRSCGAARPPVTLTNSASSLA